jgi:hypothetical protein
VATDTPAWTSTLGATGTRLTKIWATDLEVTNAPTVNGAALTTILQPLDGELTALAGLTSAANAIPYFTGSGTAGVISSSADIVSLLGSADYATALSNLGGWGVSGSITDEQLVCAETTGGSNLLKSCGAKTTYTEPASNVPICRTGSGTTGACTNSLDGVQKIASFAWDGGGSAVATANSKRCVAVPHASTIKGYTMVIDQDPGAGGTILNLSKGAYSDSALPTTAMDGTAHANPPTVADNKIASTDSTLTGWTTTVTANDIICAEVATNAVSTWISIAVFGTN